MICPTRDTSEKLKKAFQNFYEDKAHSRDILGEFETTLTDESLMACLTHLLKVMPNVGHLRRTLRGLNNLHYKCKFCSCDILSGTPICSNACIKKTVMRVIDKGCWKVNSTIRFNGLVRSLDVSCKVCGFNEVRNIEYLIAGYDCKCQSSKKSIEAQVEKGRETFYRTIKENKVPVKLLGEYNGNAKHMEFRCLRCGNHGSAAAVCIKRDEFCWKCGQDKYDANVIEKYGSKRAFYAMQRRRKKVTMLKRYGVEHALQNKDSFDKMVTSSWRRKEYKLGKRTVTVQGYEPQALDWLIKNTYIKPEEIKCGRDKEVPVIPYKWEGKSRSYHPDIFVPRLNLVIEVKAVRTYVSDLGRNLEKARSTKIQGYKYMFLVMNDKGERLDKRSL